jgi:hypothetical protein
MRLIWHLNNIAREREKERERERELMPQTHSHHGGGVDGVGEGGDATEDSSGNVYPSNLCMSSLSFMVFVFSALPPPKTPR